MLSRSSSYPARAPSRVRSVLLALILVLGFIVAARISTAAADPPTRVPVESSSLLLPGVCGFDVLVEDVQNTEVLTFFVDRNGTPRHLAINGALKVRLTNLSSGDSIIMNIPGPGRVELRPDGSQLLYATGTWLWWELPEGPGKPAGFPVLASIMGRFIVEFGADGSETTHSLTGRVDDVCAALTAA